ncbi:MAG: 50S ribosomal protein L21 [Verrucomicrobiota bacterium]
MTYAIFKTGGKQYRVSEGDKLDVEFLASVQAGDKTSFDQVLFVSNEGQASVGTPVVEGAKVEAEVVDQIRAKKVINYKFKRRKGYHRTKGHRRQLTKVQITGISA